MKVALLTGGGDCPGVNAAIRAVVRRGEQLGFELVGIRDGWRGLMEDNHFPLTKDLVSGILHLGGTILGTSRTNPFKREGGLKALQETLSRNGIEAVVVLGGEDTLGVARRLFDEGMRIVGIPKTIDNDLMGTDYAFGFDTAVAVATEAIDRLRSTAEAHSRVMVCEVMGRHTGHIALHSGLAAGADVILVPEKPIQIEEVCSYIRQRQSRGKRFSIVVVAEGAHVARSGEQTLSEELDEFGHARLGGIGNYLTREIEKRTRIETRVTVLGHIQRGGIPSARDRILATRFGLFAAEMVHRRAFGKMAALRGDEIVEVSLEEATRELKKVDPALYAAAEVFFG
jgi:phosphofructokinase-like protein